MHITELMFTHSEWKDAGLDPSGLEGHFRFCLVRIQYVRWTAVVESVVLSRDYVQLCVCRSLLGQVPLVQQDRRYSDPGRAALQEPDQGGAPACGGCALCQLLRGACYMNESGCSVWGTTEYVI